MQLVTTLVVLLVVFVVLTVTGCAPGPVVPPPYTCTATDGEVVCP